MLNDSKAETNVVFNPGASFYFGSVLHDVQEKLPERRWKMTWWDEQLRPGTSWKVPGMVHKDPCCKFLR